MTSTKTIIQFLTGTFGIATIAFCAMLTIPGAQSPDGWPGLPIWLLAIWSPSIAAIVIAYRQSRLKNLFKRLLNLRAAAPALIIIAIPILVLAAFILMGTHTPDWDAVSVPLFAALLAFNLVLGPLGEELGWRGLLQPAFEIRFGWLGAGLAVGFIWIAWHAPLWLFDSPQSEIPFWAFAGHAMFYAILMAAAHRLAPTSLIPAITLHLLFNVTVALALLWQITDIANFYSKTLPLYALSAILVAGLMRGKTVCPTENLPNETKA